LPFVLAVIYLIMSNVSRSRGFSLIELLVVVAVVTLLAAIIMPGLARAREYAYFTSCKSNLRQIGIGFLVRAADNRGQWHIGLTCSAAGRNDSHRLGSWKAYEYHKDWGRDFYTTFYDDWRVKNVHGYWAGKDWNNNLSTSYWGRPRLPGKYLSIDALWDPIAIVRDWGYNVADVMTDSNNPAYAGNAEGRDRASRRGYFGLNYAYFIGEVGCDANVSSHLNKHYFPDATGQQYSEEPYRWATNSKTLTVAHPPPCWFAACWPAGNERFGPSHHWYGHNSWRRDWFSHFGAKRAVEGIFRFNVVHLDGHVDDSLWKDDGTVENNGFPYQVPCFERGYPYGYGHYGWPNHAVKRYPDFEGAFDENL
jgi:prepilin-type N-terminal cleavage/methylation domain-containing protein